jgi:hypothetical protein
MELRRGRQKDGVFLIFFQRHLMAHFDKGGEPGFWIKRKLVDLMNGNRVLLRLCRPSFRDYLCKISPVSAPLIELRLGTQGDDENKFMFPTSLFFCFVFFGQVRLRHSADKLRK